MEDALFNLEYLQLILVSAVSFFEQCPISVKMVCIHHDRHCLYELNVQILFRILQGEGSLYTDRSVDHIVPSKDNRPMVQVIDFIQLYVYIIYIICVNIYIYI